MAVLWVGWATMITAQGGAAVDNEEGASPPPELTNKAYLFDVVQYLYRWYLDESDAEKVIGEPAVRFLVRRLPAVLDAGDRSQLAEIRLPQLGVQVLVKKADYRIEELDLEVRNDRFKIINVAGA